MSLATIYHGTPMTPRAALLDVMAGRAGCVSFFRPDDVEAVEAVCPTIMFRQRRVLILDAGGSCWRRPDRSRAVRLGGLLRMAGAATIPARKMGGGAGCARRAVSAQRRTPQRLAFRSKQGRAGLAYGWAVGAPWPAMRAVRPGVSRLDRAPQEGAGRLSCVSPQDGRSGRSHGQPLASASHAARHARGAGLSLHQRGQHQPGAERVAV